MVGLPTPCGEEPSWNLEIFREGDGVACPWINGSQEKRGCSTLLTSEDVEPILPVRLLIDHGFNLTWTSSGIDIHHPRRGALRCWKRQGCPVMHRDEAVALMKELEELEVSSSVDDDVVQWWSERYPSVPWRC